MTVQQHIEAAADAQYAMTQAIIIRDYPAIAVERAKRDKAILAAYRADPGLDDPAWRKYTGPAPGATAAAADHERRRAERIAQVRAQVRAGTYDEQAGIDATIDAITGTT